MSTVPITLLKRHVDGVWDGRELVVRAASGKMESVAKIEDKTVKVKGTGAYNTVKRLSFRPNLLDKAADEADRIGWKAVRDADPTGDQTLMRSEAELLALYSASYPYLKAEADKRYSFEDYVNDREVFLTEVRSLLEVQASHLVRYAKEMGLQVDPSVNIHLQILEASLGFKDYGKKISVREALQAVEKIRQQEGAKTTMSGDVKGATLRGKTVDMAREAAIMGAVNGVSTKAIRSLMDALGDRCPPVFKTTAGVALIQAILAWSAMSSLELPLVADRIPPGVKPKLEYAFNRQFTMAMATLTSEGTITALDLGIPLLQEYIDAVRNLELPDYETAREIPAAEEVPEPVRAPAVREHAFAGRTDLYGRE